MEKISLIILDKEKVISGSSTQLRVYDKNKLIRSCPIFRISDLIVHIDNLIRPNAFKLCTKNKIPIHFINKTGFYYGSFLQPTSRNIFLREAQYLKRLNKDFVLEFSKQIIKGKHKNQLWVLKKYQKDLHLPKPDFKNITDKSQILGIEGSIAQVYWRKFGSLIKNPNFSFRFREKRPPRDPINSLLSYGYTLLTTRFITIILSVGLDPFFGFYHENNYKRPALALDLMEEFRPIAVDLFVLHLVNKRRLKKEDFENYFGFVVLKKKAQSFFIKEWLKWWFEKKFYVKRLKSEFTLNQLAEIQTRKLAKVLVEEIKEYQPLDFTGSP